MNRRYIKTSEFIEAYVRTYLEGGSTADLAKGLGMSPSSATTRAGLLRSQGVVLPKLKRGPNL